ncbi:MAG: 16S rRNA (cytosine(967)-C(5))-methyltransferase RsmB [Proteobacteria bacterium]|nr:16S rRNA (cytosine(967)-C(5))-methyltransferase RsmB [Pseudomonadota bacterium]MDA0928171.1 16S rRNA (cytosine(967)-C(5))-methyltransferase RsmB [Pseudomonadota bacterium]
MLNTRAIAAKIIAQLLIGKGSLSTLLSPHRNRADYQLLQEICFGSCRWFYSLKPILENYLSKPVKRKDQDVLALLMIGLYQLCYMRIPDHAALNETVAAATSLGKPWARGLVNAVLRSYLRDHDRADIQASTDLGTKYSHPAWLVNSLAHAWPDQLETILAANNLRAPLTLRVNSQKSHRNTYLDTLARAGIPAQQGELATTSIVLHKPIDVFELPGFEEGLVSVQDEASQLVAPLLHLQAGHRVLDACAAPGGKTCHILESEQGLTSVLAIDVSELRLEKVKENLDRLDLQASLIAADAVETGSWWDGVHFDRILLDAPCSGSGVIRRHPDIKLLLQQEDIPKLVSQQLSLLKALWPCLTQGGLLLYTTCSVLPMENNDVISSFLEQTPSAKYEGIAADWGVECSNGRQLLPDAASGPDGFFFSLLRKL